MKFRRAIDTGGTFTDLVSADEKGRLHLTKVPTTPADLTKGIFSAIAAEAESQGMSLSEFLPDTDLIIHGCTVASNAILTGNTAKVGLICT